MFSTLVRNKIKIGLIAGDGIGKEVIPAAQRVLQSLNLEVEFHHFDAGFETFQKTGNSLPQATIDGMKECDGALFGAVSSPSTRVAGYSSPIVKLRKELDLYSNIRPIKAKWNGRNIDMVIVRENTECLYVKEEKSMNDPARPGEQIALATRRITSFASKRIAHSALNVARKRLAMKGSAKLTSVHKSNVLSISDGLFRESVIAAYKSKAEYNKITLEEQLVDSMVYRMFRDPESIDVAVAPNLYGDILSDGAAALAGSLGVVPSANVGDSFVMGEPVHGSAPDIEGKGIANPIAAIRSAGLLLEWLGDIKNAQRIANAVDQVLEQKEILTPDLKGKGTTAKVTDAVIKLL